MSINKTEEDTSSSKNKGNAKDCCICPECKKTKTKGDTGGSTEDSAPIAPFDKHGESWFNREKALTYAKYGGVAVGAACAIPIGIGFTGAGIAGGSLAALWQASIGNVAAGSAFATLQSLGATGVFATGATVGGATAAGSLAAEKIIKKEEDLNHGDKSNGEDEGNKREQIESSEDDCDDKKPILKTCSLCGKFYVDYE